MHDGVAAGAPASQADRNMGMYAVYDLVAGEILNNMVWLFPHVAPARRMFADAVKADPQKSRVAAHPEDYALVYLGMVSIWTLSVIDVGTYSQLVSESHKAIVCTGAQV